MGCASKVQKTPAAQQDAERRRDGVKRKEARAPRAAAFGLPKVRHEKSGSTALLVSAALPISVIERWRERHGREAARCGL